MDIVQLTFKVVELCFHFNLIGFPICRAFGSEPADSVLKLFHIHVKIIHLVTQFPFVTRGKLVNSSQHIINF